MKQYKTLRMCEIKERFTHSENGLAPFYLSREKDDIQKSSESTESVNYREARLTENVPILYIDLLKLLSQRLIIHLQNVFLLKS